MAERKLREAAASATKDVVRVLDDLETAALRSYITDVNKLMIDKGFPCEYTAHDFYDGTYNETAWGKLLKLLQTSYDTVSAVKRDEKQYDEPVTYYSVTIKGPARTK
jgi:hypothetical protein